MLTMARRNNRHNVRLRPKVDRAMCRLCDEGGGCNELHSGAITPPPSHHAHFNSCHRLAALRDCCCGLRVIRTGDKQFSEKIILNQ
jgi:hypothetical protein